jgi:hypothetical protein
MEKVERLAVSAVAMAIVASRRSRAYGQRLSESDHTTSPQAFVDPFFKYLRPRPDEPAPMPGH